MTAVIPNIGLVYDTRDDEISPRSGAFDILGVRAGIGISEARTRYVGASLVLRHYFPLVGPLVFATRFMADVIVGDAPFFDQIKGITFTPVTMFGGARGIRGVPDGRYAGKVKLLATAELRALLADFHLFDQHFRIGAQTFVDSGRVQSDLTADASLDGNGLGLKYGVGAGTYVRWGEGALIRAEIAYSPDARVYTGSFPFGVYIVDSHSF
jgi:outer membrane protein assembly factor BamA